MIEVSLLESMGNDLTVVNAARVSFGKKVKKFSSKDKKLIKYLAKHNHCTPFGHVTMQFHIKAPIFVARQLVKHQVGLVWNEISRRYVDTEPEFYVPDSWRGRVLDKKQGSDPDVSVSNVFTSEYPHLMEHCKNLYNKMLDSDVCPEQARIVLPQSLMTEWYWTGSMVAFARVCNLRCQDDSQYETRLVAEHIDEKASKIASISWSEMRK